jgi:hypothetical protein
VGGSGHRNSTILAPKLLVTETNAYSTNARRVHARSTHANVPRRGQHDRAFKAGLKLCELRTCTLERYRRYRPPSFRKTTCALRVLRDGGGLVHRGDVHSIMRCLRPFIDPSLHRRELLRHEKVKILVSSFVIWL